MWQFQHRQAVRSTTRKEAKCTLVHWHRGNRGGCGSGIPEAPDMPVSDVEKLWTIVGQVLAGTCLAWALWDRGEGFLMIDRGAGGSSRVAAGMVYPITGKNFEPSWRIA